MAGVVYLVISYLQILSDSAYPQHSGEKSSDPLVFSNCITKDIIFVSMKVAFKLPDL